MKTEEDLHNYRWAMERFDSLLGEIPGISKDTLKLCREFKHYSMANGITSGRIARYLFDLRVLLKWIDCDIRKATRKDIEKLVFKIESSDYKPSTKRDLKITLRKFIKWMKGTDELPPEVSWIKTGMKDRTIKSPDEMLTEDEVKRLADQAPSIRDKAFIMTLYESGCRIGEILPMKLKSLHFDEYGAQLHVTGKTGYRRVRIIASVPILKAWLNQHPYRNDPNCYLWLCNGSFMAYSTCLTMLRLVAKKAGIRKGVNPHNFRHSRATYLANHLTEAQMKEYFGWYQASRMAAIYVHISGRDVDKSLLQLYGIKIDDDTEKSKINPLGCPQCKTQNSAGSLFCSLCGIPLSEEARLDSLHRDMDRKDADNMLNVFMKDPDFMRVFAEKVNAFKSHHSHKPQPQEANGLIPPEKKEAWNEQKPIRPPASAQLICAPDASPTSICSSARKANAKSAGRGSSSSTTCGGAGNEGKD